MPEFLQVHFYQNTISQWLIAAAIAIGAAVLGKFLYYVSSGIARRMASKTESKLDDIILDVIEEPVVFAVILFGIRFAFSTLTLSIDVSAWLGLLFHFVIVGNIAWLLSRLFESLFEQYLIPLAEQSKSDLDDQLLPIMRKGIKIAIWTVAIIVALDSAGYNVRALIAGMGIGGLALAMASKDTVANMFGGITIFTDQPFKLNDRVKVAGYDGSINEIGIRSTRLRTLEGRIVTIPNSTFADSPVENVTLEPSRKVVTNLGLVYETSAVQMKKAMAMLKVIADETEGVAEDPVIAFNAFGDFAMNILFIYYIEPDNDIMGIQTHINLAILELFGEHKLDMAFPTQTVYHQAV